MKYITILFIFGWINTIYGGQDFVGIMERCNRDNLNIPQAHGRNAWTIKCFDGTRGRSDERLLISAMDKRDRPMYPAISNHNEKKWGAPLERKAQCDGPNKDFTNITGFCTASCYPPDQQILFTDGYSAILDAFNERKTNLVTLAKHSTMDNLQFDTHKVYAYSKSRRDAPEMIRELKMKSGGSLKVTLNHPMLVSDGTMKLASDLQIGYFLIKETGEHDEIISIEDVEFVGKVYNVAPDSLDPLENIVVAEGYLTGSANYQYHELFQDLMYRQLLRRTLKVE